MCSIQFPARRRRSGPIARAESPTRSPAFECRRRTQPSSHHLPEPRHAPACRISQDAARLASGQFAMTNFRRPNREATRPPTILSIARHSRPDKSDSEIFRRSVQLNRGRFVAVVDTPRRTAPAKQKRAAIIAGRMTKRIVCVRLASRLRKKDAIRPQVAIFINPQITCGIEFFKTNNRQIRDDNDRRVQRSEGRQTRRRKWFTDDEFAGQFLPQLNVAVSPLFEHWRSVTNQLPSIAVDSDIEPEPIQIEIRGVRSLILSPPRIFYQNCVSGSLFANPIQQLTSALISIFTRRLDRKKITRQLVCWHAYHQRQNKDYSRDQCAIPKIPRQRNKRREPECQQENQLVLRLQFNVNNERRQTHRNREERQYDPRALSLTDAKPYCRRRNYCNQADRRQHGVSLALQVSEIQ